MGNRFSSLPIAQFCGLAPQLSARAGAGRSAAMGTAFHARCADPSSVEARDAWARLTSEEQAEVATWLRPTELVLESGVTLRYEDAHKELPLGLAPNGSYAPKGTPGNITEGTCDICWVVEVQPSTDGCHECARMQSLAVDDHVACDRHVRPLRIAYVPDIKRSEWTVADGPDSLQILGYAMAAASKFGCDGYCAGIWGAKEGKWWWGPLFLWERDEDAMLEHWRRIRAAALNHDPSPSHGRHCAGCYGRTSCPAWLAPPELLGTSLAPFAKEGLVISGQEAANLLLKVKQVEDMAELVKRQVKAAQKSGLRVIDAESGKEWRPVRMPGRITVDSGALEREQPEVFQRYAKTGQDYEQHRWVNAKTKG